MLLVEWDAAFWDIKYLVQLPNDHDASMHHSKLNLRWLKDFNFSFLLNKFPIFSVWVLLFDVDLVDIEIGLEFWLFTWFRPSSSLTKIKVFCFSLGLLCIKDSSAFEGFCESLEFLAAHYSHFHFDPFCYFIFKTSFT